MVVARHEGALGATRLVETSRGWFGVELGGLRRRGSLLAWRDGRWIAGAERIEFEPTAPSLADALAGAGLPPAEATAVAEMVLDEWEARLAEIRRRARTQSARLDLDAVALPALLALWTTGAAFLSLRAWRAFR